MAGISLQHGSYSLVSIKFYMYKTTKTPSFMIYIVSAAGQCLGIGLGTLCSIILSIIALPSDLSIIEHNSKILGHNDSNKCYGTKI